MKTYILIGILCSVIFILIAILVSYQRQVKNICRQLHFLKEHESNMLVTKEMSWGNIRELTELLNELLRERKRERKAYLQKEQMIADTYTNLSHDIRTPLTSLNGYVQLLKRAETEEDRGRYLQIIEERIDSLKEMLEELFTYTKLQNEAYELTMERQNVNRILKETVFSYYDEWRQRGITPRFAITEEPIWIQGNEQAIRRTIQNIIKNELDHGKKEIEICLEKKGERMELLFRNRAETPENIDVSRVFDRFYKADTARSKNSTGLGLSIAKGFVERMHGRIEASMESEWFCIKIWMPCEGDSSD